MKVKLLKFDTVLNNGCLFTHAVASKIVDNLKGKTLEAYVMCPGQSTHDVQTNPGQAVAFANNIQMDHDDSAIVGDLTFYSTTYAGFVSQMTFNASLCGNGKTIQKFDHAEVYEYDPTIVILKT
jgi:hypothetical protein